MHFTQIWIDDFGCFQNARLDDLSDSLVVVGGPQRAGKTTFITAMRQLKSGVGRSGGFPPAADEYRLRGEIIHESHPYRYTLTGHAAPSIARLDGGPSIDVDDIFGPVTERQYRQLFTISLDELRRLPPGIDDADDLAEILLGAAYGDVAQIPLIQEQFQKRAKEIGLTRGSPTATTGELNAPYTKIQRGLEARREANQQVKKHAKVTETLQAKRSDLSEVIDNLSDLQERRTRLNVLKELFDTLVEINELESILEEADVDAAKNFSVNRTERIKELRDDFETAASNHRQATRAFERSTSVSNLDEYMDWLLNNEELLEEFGNNRRMWQSQIDDLSETEAELSTQRRRIESQIDRLHPDWAASFDHVESIDTTEISASRVRSLAKAVDELQETLAEEHTEKERKRTKLSELETERDQMTNEESDTREVTIPKKKPTVIAAAGLAVGTIVTLVTTPLVGGLIGLIVVVVGMYTLDTTFTIDSAIDADPYREVSSQISTQKSEIAAHEDRIEELDSGLQSKRERLHEIAQRIGLPDDVEPLDVASFYQEVTELNEAIREYQSEHADWMTNRNELVEDLKSVASVLDDGPGVTWDPDSPLKRADSLLSQLKTAIDDLADARNIRDAEARRADRLNQINAILAGTAGIDLLNDSDDTDTVNQRAKQFTRAASNAQNVVEADSKHETLASQVNSRFSIQSTRDVFEPLRTDDETWLNVVRSALEEYADVSALDSALRSLENEITTKESERDQLQEQCRELKAERDELASEDDLRAAQNLINEGRIEFERVGEAYAVDRIAEKLLNDLHRRFMAELVGTLIDDASEIFAEITQEYDGIELGDDLQDLEFQAIRSDRPDHGVGELSRATAEQLFLAVRIARIRQTTVSLPVVIDDATTNFDPSHATRVFEVLGELTETNQVFFLTCHPAFVDLVCSNGIAGQCWSLEEGQFNQMEDSEALQQWLWNGTEEQYV